MNKPLVIFSTQGWTDLWVSKHWIAHEFSKDRLVLFVEPPSRVTPPEFFRGEFCRAQAKQIQNNLYALPTVTFPFPYRIPSLLRGLWRWPIFKQFSAAVHDLGIDQFDVLSFDPHSQSLIKKYGDKVSHSIYYAVDPPLGREDAFWSEARCVKESDHVFAVTPLLKDLLVRESGRKDVSVLPHGVDYEDSEDFSAQPPEQFETLLEDIEEDDVVIGYTGAIHDVCIDQEVVLEAIRKRPGWKFVFVGPYKGSTLSKQTLDISLFENFDNVFLTGAVPYQYLKYFVKRFDVCIVPYNSKINVNWKRRSPFKVLGYLAQGKPVVISNVPAAKDYGELVYEYEDLDGFLMSCERALESASDSPKRKEFAAAHDFSILKNNLNSVLS